MVLFSKAGSLEGSGKATSGVQIRGTEHLCQSDECGEGGAPVGCACVECAVDAQIGDMKRPRRNLVRRGQGCPDVSVTAWTGLSCVVETWARDPRVDNEDPSTQQCCSTARRCCSVGQDEGVVPKSRRAAAWTVADLAPPSWPASRRVLSPAPVQLRDPRLPIPRRRARALSSPGGSNATTQSIPGGSVPARVAERRQSRIIYARPEGRISDFADRSDPNSQQLNPALMVTKGSIRLTQPVVIVCKP